MAYPSHFITLNGLYHPKYSCVNSIVVMHFIIHFCLFLFMQPSAYLRPHAYTQSLHYAVTKCLWCGESKVIFDHDSIERQEIFTEWAQDQCGLERNQQQESIPILWSVCPSGVWIGLPPGTPSGRFALEEKYLSPFWTLFASGKI